MKKEMNYFKKGMKRRDFIATTALGVGGMSFMSSFSIMFNKEMDFSIKSPMDIQFTLKFINDGIVHEDAWEGSCRFGELKNLTYDAEMNYLNNKMKNLRETLASKKMPRQIKLLEPVTMHSWVEKGNPDIMLPDKQLDMLAEENDKTDMYVVSSPYMGYRIARRYRKPICIFQPHGWGVDGTAGIRPLGVEAFHVTTWEELIDLTQIMCTRKSFSGTKLLSVTNFPDRVPWGVVSNITNLDFIKQKYGLDYEIMDYRDFFGYMDQIENNADIQHTANELAKKLQANSVKSNMSEDNISKSILFYLTVATMMEKQKCNAFTIECFELCSSLHPWNRKFTPCLTHALLKDMGIPSACEGDINALLSMMVQMYLSNKAIYMGNPDVDKVNNILKIHHSVASLQMFGIEEKPTPYEIQSFMQAGYGATLRHNFSEYTGKIATVGRFHPNGTKLLITHGKVIGGSGLDGCGCAQNVEIEITSGKRFWKKSQDYGHHLSFVYGDYTSQIEELGELMGFEVENIG